MAHIYKYRSVETRRKTAWCGAELKKNIHISNIDNAIKYIDQDSPVQPCPDCARAIIKQLLKAIE